MSLMCACVMRPQIRNAVASGVVRELQMPKLLQRMYGCLGKCCRVYTDQDVQPGYSQVDSLRKTLRELINQHYRKVGGRAGDTCLFQL